MPTFHVTWSIDIDAADPRSAAQQALEIQRDPASIATCFKVEESGVGGLLTIDLSKPAPVRKQAVKPKLFIPQPIRGCTRP